MEKSRKNKNFWRYLNRLLIVMVPLLVLSSFFVIVKGSDNDDVIMIATGMAMWPLTGLLIVPNIIAYAIKRSEKWKIEYVYKYISNNKNIIITPDPMNVHMRKKLLAKFWLHQILDLIAIIIGVITVIVIGVFSMLNGRFSRAQGIGFFSALLCVILGFPWFVYCLTNSICRFKIYLKHKYITCYGTILNVDNYNMTLLGTRARHPYGVSVGIRTKDVKNLEALLVFIGDQVYFFPKYMG